VYIDDPKLEDERAMTFADKFGANLRVIREDRGLTQEHVAWQCRLHPTQLSKIERGKSVPGAETVGKLIAVLDTPPSDLYEGIGWDANDGAFVVVAR
jgi:transcriptional regulator with XRE-family HTH domain